MVSPERLSLGPTLLWCMCGNVSIAIRDACRGYCLIFVLYLSVSSIRLIESGGIFASVCSAVIGDVFMTPRAILINVFCIVLRDFSAVLQPPAYTTAPNSIIGSTNDLYKRSKVARSASHGVLVIHLNKLCLELQFVFMCLACCCMESRLSSTTPKNLNLETYGMML